MRRNSQAGFTLLELITVVAIVGVLSALVALQYNSFVQKSKRTALLTYCNQVYRAFTVYYIENNEYPLQGADPDPDKVGPLGRQLDLATLSPLTREYYMGLESGFEPMAKGLLEKVHNNRAEAFDSPDDDLGINQEFYIVFAMREDPSIKFIVANANDITDGDGNLIDAGNWLDGIYMAQNGVIIQ